MGQTVASAGGPGGRGSRRAGNAPKYVWHLGALRARKCHTYATWGASGAHCGTSGALGEPPGPIGSLRGPNQAQTWVAIHARQKRARRAPFLKAFACMFGQPLYWCNREQIGRKVAKSGHDVGSYTRAAEKGSPRTLFEGFCLYNWIRPGKATLLV